MSRLTVYFDFGSGYQLVAPHQVNYKVGIRREINPFIQRKYMDGSFVLLDSDYDSAKTFYITNGNDECPIQVYENGTISTGVLIFEGWAAKEGIFDDEKRVCTINGFRVNDKYTPFLKWVNIENISTQLGMALEVPNRSALLIQDQNSANGKIQGYAWNGTQYAVTGNSYSLGNIGAIAGTMMGTTCWAYIDNFNNKIKVFNYSAPDWSPSPSINDLLLTEEMGNASLAGDGSTVLYIAGDYGGRIRKYALSGPTLVQQAELILFSGNMAHPAIDVINASGDLAYVDDISQEVKFIGNGLTSISYGTGVGINGEKFDVCRLDTSSNTVAVIDEKTKTLRAIQATGINLAEIASIKLTINERPKISQAGTNVVVLHDPQSGSLTRYTFTPGSSSWAQTGTPITVAGGYSAAIPEGAGNIVGLVRSNSMMLYSNYGRSFANAMEGVILGNEYQNMPDAFDYELPTTSGASFDIDDLSILSLKEISTSYLGSFGIDSTMKYSFQSLFDLAEIYQNYWYLDIEVDSRPNKIKFTQPRYFSSSGTDIDVSALASVKNRREYKKDFSIFHEIFEFKNERYEDFINFPIEYNRNTEVEITKAYDYTTDAQNLINYLLGLNSDLSKSGKFLCEIDPAEASDFNIELIPSGTTAIGNSNIYNYLASKTQILENYLKDYRYSDNASFTINESSITPGTDNFTCRDIVGFPSVDLKLDDFPTDIANLDWGSGIKSYVTDLALDPVTNKVTVESILLDL